MAEEINEPKNRVGKIIREYRERKDLTQLDLAKELGYNYGNFIGMIESGRSIFPLAKGKWLEYAKVIKMDPTEFLIYALCDVHPEMETFLMPLLGFYKKQKK